MKKLQTGFRELERKFNLVGVSFLVAMMVLVTVDVASRYLFNAPILGAMELSQFMMVILVFFGLAYTAAEKGHIMTEMVVSRLSPRMKAIVNSFVALLGAALFGIMTWQGTLDSMEWFKMRGISDILRIPIFPFRLLVPLGALFLSIELLIQLVDSISEAIKPQDTGNREGAQQSPPQVLQESDR
ncbi:MAG: TRAP transporter small permease [Chloroflexi bacterium]|nr:TRAP transporter small permease [Chloroflexota bacterium]